MAEPYSNTGSYGHSSGIANPNQLIARTDGRTNGRPTHLPEISPVGNRARYFESDLALTRFLATASEHPYRAKKLRIPASELARREYDAETDNLTRFMQGDGAA